MSETFLILEVKTIISCSLWTCHVATQWPVCCKILEKWHYPGYSRAWDREKNPLSKPHITAKDSDQVQADCKIPDLYFGVEIYVSENTCYKSAFILCRCLDNATCICHSFYQSFKWQSLWLFTFVTTGGEEEVGPRYSWNKTNSNHYNKWGKKNRTKQKPTAGRQGRDNTEHGKHRLEFLAWHGRVITKNTPTKTHRQNSGSL